LYDNYIIQLPIRADGDGSIISRVAELITANACIYHNLEYDYITMTIQPVQPIGDSSSDNLEDEIITQAEEHAQHNPGVMDLLERLERVELALQAEAARWTKNQTENLNNLKETILQEIRSLVIVETTEPQEPQDPGPQPQPEPPENLAAQRSAQKGRTRKVW
jgi:hypothetical protein